MAESTKGNVPGSGGGGGSVDERVRNLQRAIYYLIWKRTGFGEHCVHCNHAFPGHENKCKAAEVEALIR